MDSMTNIYNLGKCALIQNKFLDKIIKGKEQRRKDLSGLSFKEKIYILVELQKMARGVTKHGKASDRIVWQI
jgi:hypothetical protein